MADAAVGFLLENLTQLLKYNAELIGDARNQVEGLLKDLKMFKAFIRDCTEKRTNNHTLQELVNNIRSVVDKAEDAIDTFVVHKAIFKARNPLGKTIHAIDHSITIKGVAKEIESIRNEVSEIYTKKQFGFQALQLEEFPDRAPTEKKPLSVEQDNVVGFKGEAETVINFLMDAGKDLDIITIIGMPGLGKTTLAKMIFNDTKIEYEFFSRLWVSVTQKYNRKDIFLSILSKFGQTTEHLNKSEEDIGVEVRKCLEEGKYLIVLDDVWEKEDWEHLKDFFPNNKKGSRILITSRHRHLARHANPNKKPHDLKFLSSEESWELLEKKVFGKEKCPRADLKAVGMQIATACKGLPLAIVVIAGILLNNRESRNWWSQVAGDVNAFVLEEQEKLLALSYDNLPYHLRSCFLYVGVFPKGSEIPVWKLVLLWIAEGFIEHNTSRSLEEIAEACLEELVNRNLLITLKRRSNGQIKTCRVHDILHDFCKKEAQKQRFYHEIKDKYEVNLDEYRRVCIHSEVKKHLCLKPTGPHVRSFLCFAPDEFNLPKEHISTIPKAFGLLRVLEIRSITFDIFPKDLLVLALLRYIAITCNIKIIPSTISRLWNMQTLIFITNARTLELKADMWKMFQLRHLRTSASAMLPAPPPNAPNTRENVQSLTRISPESCTEKVFSRTPNIKKLGIRGKVVVLFENYFKNIGRLESLTNLKLFNDVFPDPPSECRIRLPQSHMFPMNLQTLTLAETWLDWDQMEILGELKRLEMLKLKDNAFKGALWEPILGGFQSLKLSNIGRTDLVTWEATEQHFPSLERLVLRHCDQLQAVPLGFANSLTLQVLELYRTSRNAAASARKIQAQKSAGFKLAIYPPDI